MRIYKNIFEIKFASIAKDTAETSIKSRICQYTILHYTTPRDTFNCDSDGVTGDRISYR
jgi:hypothetical protein